MIDHLICRNTEVTNSRFSGRAFMGLHFILSLKIPNEILSSFFLDLQVAKQP